MLTVTHLSKHYGDQAILHDVNFTLGSGQHMGLVGANGSGKSTLLRLLLGQEGVDAGQIELSPGVTVGYLPQSLAEAPGQSVDQLLDAGLGKLREMEYQLHGLERQMAQAEGPTLAEILTQYGRLAEIFERRGGYDLEHRLDAVFAGLGVAYVDRSRPVATLSGGEKSRVALAALLLRSPDLLLLDEPTNHLDFAALAWLEGYLASFSGGLLVVSHDRHFLNCTAHQILALDEHQHTAHIYTGNYDTYAAARAVERQQLEETYWQEQEEIKALRQVIRSKGRQVAHNRPSRDNEKFAYTHKGGRVDAAISRNVAAAEEKLRRIEANPAPQPPRPLVINPEFDAAVLTGRSPLTVVDLSKSYGDLTVLDRVSFALEPRSRIALVGPNGAGKSTLLRILAGLEQADAGDLFLAASTVIGYLDQEQEGLDPAQTVYEAYRQGRSGYWEEFKTELLSYHLFGYEDLAKPVGDLSIGQQRKVQLAQLISRRANLLLLDEPTNHVSFDVLEEFEAALLDFPGPVLAVSHDRHFLQRFGGEIWELRHGALRRFRGGWEAAQPEIVPD